MVCKVGIFEVFWGVGLALSGSRRAYNGYSRAWWYLWQLQWLCLLVVLSAAES